MSYLIYLKRSYRYRLKRHMALYVILTCAMVLPLIFSIFRDSIIFGQQSFVQQQTQGQVYQVLNAKAEYLEYFKDIIGLSTYYEGNTIFINIVSEEDMNNPVRKAEFDQSLFRIINEIKDEQLLLMDMSRFGTDESNYLFTNQLLFVNAIIIIISFIIIQSTYKNYFNKFIPDLGILVSYGADNKQIQRIFLIDFFVIFVISALSAVAMSSVLMYILFRNFLQVKDIGNLSWVIFKINPYSLAVHLIFFGATLLLIIKLLLSKNLKKTSAKMLHESGEKINYKSKTFEIKKDAVNSLAKLLFHRTKRQVINCLIITIPITITVIFIFNYLIINIENISKLPNYEITIHKDVIMPNEVGILDSDIAFVKKVEGIKSMEEELNLPTTKYLIKDQRMKGNSLVVFGDNRYAQTGIQSYSNIDNKLKNKNFYANKYNIAISKNHEYLKYKVGDKIYLYLNDMNLTNVNIEHNEENEHDEKRDYDTDSMWIVSEPIELTVVQLLDNEWTDRMFPIYFTDEMYKELTKGETVAKVKIKLDNPTESKKIELVLKSKFVDSRYVITNNQEIFQKNKETSMGIYIMALFIFSIMFTFILMILYVKLTIYVESQHENIRIFHILGASEADIYESYMQLPMCVSMISIIVSFVIGLGLCILFFMNTGYHLISNLTTISIHLLIAMTVLAAFNVPVHVTLKNKLKQL